VIVRAFSAQSLTFLAKNLAFIHLSRAFCKKAAGMTSEEWLARLDGPVHSFFVMARSVSVIKWLHICDNKAFFAPFL
jgi:hypothetical protein